MPWIIWLIPATLIPLAVPLILRKVPPNAFYGFRTPTTLSDANTWYEANRGAGWDMLLAGCAMLLFLAVKPFVPALSAMHPGPFVLSTQIPVLFLAIAHSVWRLRKL